MSRSFASMRGADGTRSALWWWLARLRTNGSPSSRRGRPPDLAVRQTANCLLGRDGMAARRPPRAEGRGGQHPSPAQSAASGPSIYSLAGVGRRFMERVPYDAWIRQVCYYLCQRGPRVSAGGFPGEAGPPPAERFNLKRVLEVWLTFRRFLATVPACRPPHRLSGRLHVPV